MARTLKVKIYRHDPDSGEAPHYDTFMVEETPGMSVFNVMDQIQCHEDGTLYYDICCRSNVCGSCAMTINGQPKLACRTQTGTLPDELLLEPLSYFPLIKDVATDKGTWLRDVSLRTKAWMHNREDREFNPDHEQQQSDKVARQVYEADRCIECGICVAACGSCKIDPDYLGPMGLNRALKLAADDRDHRGFAGVEEIVKGEAGVFGCEAMVGCSAFCPKEIPLPKHIATLRTNIIKETILKSLFGKK